MAIRSPAATDVLTYEQYMAEGVIEGRYDIIDGVRIFMSAPTWQHQRIVIKLTRIFMEYEERSGTGLALSAPFDILIRRQPRLQTRQPDVLFITHATLARGGGIPAKGPLEVGPELVVEIISDSERESLFAAKVADYTAIGVQECWRVVPEARSVEVLRLAPTGPVSVATYDESQSLHSVTFPVLTVSVADIFQARIRAGQRLRLALRFHCPRRRAPQEAERDRGISRMNRFVTPSS
jgi:Uma2 family endonuclease